MKGISQLVVHVFDLIEAEGSTLLTVVRGEAQTVRSVATNLVLGAAFLLVAIPLFISGAWLIAAGLMWWLETQLGRPLAASLTGLVTLSAGGCCLIAFKALTARGRP